MTTAAEKDRGLTHVALLVRDPEASIAFYARYARMQVVHRRRDEASGRQVLWLSDLTRPFVIVLIQAERVEGRLDGFAHLGVGCESRAEVDRLCALAREEGRLGHPTRYVRRNLPIWSSSPSSRTSSPSMRRRLT